MVTRAKNSTKTLIQTAFDSPSVYETNGEWPTKVIVSRVDFSSTEPLERLHKTDYELFLPTRPLTVTEVSGNYHRKYFQYRSGTVAFSYPGISWQIEWEGTIEGVSIIWHPEVIKCAALKLFGEYDELVWRKALSDHAPAIAYLGLEIANLITVADSAKIEYIDLLTETLLALCLRRYTTSESRNANIVGVTSRQILLAIKFINANLKNDISIDAICDQSATSKSHLNRLFRTEVGLSPWDFVQKQRIKAAGELLKNSDQAVQDICLGLRFKSRSSFTKRFVQEFKCTPREYRKQH